jgi:hypothetical protein
MVTTAAATIARRSRRPDADEAEPGGVIVRRIIVAVAALLLAAQVIRDAAVRRLAQAKPAAAVQIWASHPAAEISLAMVRIAEAARDRRAVPSSAFSLMNDAAAKAPLAPEPFLVRGVQQQLAGENTKAQRAFEAAQWRDPRSLPAAYFLADRYLLVGNIDKGLAEVAALARLAPNGAMAVGPYLAAYARNSANWPALRTLFRNNPRIAEPALVSLALNIETVPAVLALAEPDEGAARAVWLPPLLRTLIDAGRYAKARAVWARASGVQSNALIYDTSFSDKSAPPPFNWSFTSSAVGLAEREPGGRLHAVFYGQDDGILATQLLLLPPGSYRLSMHLAPGSANAKALTWSLWCDKALAPIGSVTLDASTRGWRFDVPSGCSAQWLKLSGASADIPQQADVTIAGLRLEKAIA